MEDIDALTRFMQNCMLEVKQPPKEENDDVEMYHTDEDEFTYSSKYENPEVKRIILEGAINGVEYDEDSQEDIENFIWFVNNFYDAFRKVYNMSSNEVYERFVDMIQCGSPVIYLEKLKKEYPDYEEVWEDIDF